MSCGLLCQCQLSWPLDTLGLKRDPINSEKAWLDFAVRLLSREMVGKGKGQETVWSVKCKPVWWDSAVGLPWKNPTSNPKDTKEVLQMKYSALEKCLRNEGRFPKELEEEAKLWGEGKVKELYLQTHLTSLLSKVTSLHCTVDDACKKVKEMNAKVNNSLVSDITKCLNATLRALDNLQCSYPVIAKRPYSQNGKENVNSESRPPKCRKVEPIATFPSKPSHISVQVQQASLKNVNSEILTMAQKLIDKRRQQKSPMVKNVKRIAPKPEFSPCINNSTIQPLVISVLNLSAQQLNHLLQTNPTLSSSQSGQSLQMPAISLNMADLPATNAADLYSLHQNNSALSNSEADCNTQPSRSLPSVLSSSWEDSTFVSPSTNDPSPLNSVISHPFCDSSAASSVSPPCKINLSPSASPPSSTYSPPSTSNSLSPHEDSLSSFLLSNESSDYAHTIPPSISPCLGNGGELDLINSIDITVFDNMELSGDFDEMLEWPELGDGKSNLENSLSEEDGSNFLEKYLQGLEP